MLFVLEVAFNFDSNLMTCDIAPSIRAENASHGSVDSARMSLRVGDSLLVLEPPCPMGDMLCLEESNMARCSSHLPDPDRPSPFNVWLSLVFFVLGVAFNLNVSS